MYLGINISHDSSAALITPAGELVNCIAEERLSRKKHDTCFPIRAIASVLSTAGNPHITQTVIGSHSNFDLVPINYLRWLFESDHPVNFDAKHGHMYPPGFPYARDQYLRAGSASSLRSSLSAQIHSVLLSVDVDAPISYQNHHDSHALSSIGASGFRDGIAISLDGEGDGESGVVKRFWSDNESIRVQTLARIPSTSSLGALYSAVTRRYNFKHNSHEGKILGLAAYGSGGPALDFLLQTVSVNSGVPTFALPRSRWLRGLTQVARQLLRKSTLLSSLDDLADVAASYTTSYADLAYAVQKCLEQVVISCVSFYTPKEAAVNITLAGGVFSNVRLNQAIADLPNARDVFIFPDMGDSGLAAGGVWDWMQKNDKLRSGLMLRDMYLGPNPSYPVKLTTLPSEINLKSFVDETSWARTVAELIAQGKIVGVIRGRMESGPRALMNRSLLADPRDPNLNGSLNRRLRRTEFMPFAPVCRDVDFHDLFDPPQLVSTRAFEFMTMTCLVRPHWRSKIPAVVHVDGTARPQLLRETVNPGMYNVVASFAELTGTPCLVNTSFNVHEEPIIQSEESGLHALNTGVIDALALDRRILLRGAT